MSDRHLTRAERDLQLIAQVRNLLSEPRYWTSCTLARNANGTECRPASPEAVRWCVMGAFHKVLDVNDYDIDVAKKISRLLGYDDPMEVTNINDTVGYTAAKMLLDEAEKRIKAEDILP